jgi:cysteinyl-tRNA synthetase
MVSYRQRKEGIFSNSKYNRNILESKLVKTYLDTQIKLLLYRIHYLHPTLFTMIHLNKELEVYNKWNPIIQFASSKTTNNKKVNAINTSKNKIQHNKQKLNNKRCISRVYNNNNIIYKDNIDNKQINKTVISDDILESYIFGRQCYGTRIGNTKYCFVHCKHNPHGDFNKPPSKQIKEHFIMLHNNKLQKL